MGSDFEPEDKRGTMVDSKEWETTVFIAEPLLERLSSYSLRTTDGDDDGEQKAKAASGVIYGVRVSHMSKSAVILNATGCKVVDDDREQIEILTEILPCGLDAYGVFHLSDDEDDVDRIAQLVSQLPDSLLETNDPVVLVRREGRIKALVHLDGELKERHLKPLSRSDLEEDVVTVRVRGNLTLNCGQTQPELSNAFKELIEKVASPYGTFQLDNSDVFFLHTFESKNKPQTGWVAGDKDFGNDDSFEEDCLVTNVNDLEGGDDDNDERVVAHLWSAIKTDRDVDDGFGSAQANKLKKKKKQPVFRLQTMNFRLKMKMSGSACTSRTVNCAPVINYEKRTVKSVKIPLKIDALGLAATSMKISDLMEVLKGAVQRQIHEMARSVLSEFKMRATVSLPQAFHLLPSPFGHFATIIYTKTGTCANFAQFRKHLHRIFLLPVDRPYFRRQNKFVFDDEKVVGKGSLTNVHAGLEGGVAGVNDDGGGEVFLMDGTYEYHHYMQDGFDDDGWGCAYRSLQTIISWFRHQGYTETAVPNHVQIQKCLVKVGDKEEKFVGSAEWIGSTEVGYVLDESCNVQSKFLFVSSGAEMPSKARELAHHFKTQGTPVMIGGGVLAHTILGVQWNENTGDVCWLILDPHFTGADWTNSGKPNVAQMQSKGRVGWKRPDFWVKSAFYNMCMPQRPVQW